MCESFIKPLSAFLLCSSEHKCHNRTGLFLMSSSPHLLLSCVILNHLDYFRIIQWPTDLSQEPPTVRTLLKVDGYYMLNFQKAKKEAEMREQGLKQIIRNQKRNNMKEVVGDKWLLKEWFWVVEYCYSFYIQVQTSVTGRVCGVLFRNTATFNLNKNNTNNTLGLSIDCIYTCPALLKLQPPTAMLKQRNYSTQIHRSLPNRPADRRRNKENSRQPFNTRGYYDPLVPYDDNYIQAKEKAFHKFRTEQDGYTMIKKDNHRGALIQRGCLVPLKQQDQNVNQSKSYLDKATISLVKNYFLRKEKKEVRNNQKFADPPKIKAEILYSKSSNNSRVCSRGGGGLSSHVTRSTQLPNIADF